MDTTVSPTASQTRAAVKYHLEQEKEEKEERLVIDGHTVGGCSKKSVCDFQITSKDYKRLALFPGANGVVSFVYFQGKNII